MDLLLTFIPLPVRNFFSAGCFPLSFFEIAFIQDLCMCTRVCMCVCPHPKTINLVVFVRLFHHVNRLK